VLAEIEAANANQVEQKAAKKGAPAKGGKGAGANEESIRNELEEARRI